MKYYQNIMEFTFMKPHRKKGSQPLNDPLAQAASGYFRYLAERFPVMCASDEFHFLPRAESASRYYDRLDDLDAGAMKESIDILKGFRKVFDRLRDREDDLEKRIDLDLLGANATGILIELEESCSWRHNPLLYLKIAFIGLDHAMNKPVDDPHQRIERTLTRLDAIPRILNQAVQNIENVPETYYSAAVSMIRDCKRYLDETGKHFSSDGSTLFVKGLQKASAALETLNRFLDSVSLISDQDHSVGSVEASLKEHFLSARSVEEVFRIAEEDRRSNLVQLERLRSCLNPGKSWQALYHDFHPSDIGEMETMSLYRREMEQMRQFFSTHGFSYDDLNAPLKIIETPTYLRSVRSAASFGAAFSDDAREESYFYITTRPPSTGSKDTATLLRKRLHREFKFLSAHETIPGHHLLDSLRRKLKNPVRRQIESPLFYEGWAYYAESLLTEFGYVTDPMEQLIDYKRRLWRAARCQIDIGLPLGLIELNDAVALLTTSGFSMEEAIGQIHRYRLNPGYQLCYTLGRYEILRLKAAYGNKMGNERFHAFLLGGGELPFHLIEERLAAHTNG
jgi:uncharacterized protein (DUF885 family)